MTNRCGRDCREGSSFFTVICVLSVCPACQRVWLSVIAFAVGGHTGQLTSDQFRIVGDWVGPFQIGLAACFINRPHAAPERFP